LAVAALRERQAVQVIAAARGLQVALVLRIARPIGDRARDAILDVHLLGQLRRLGRVGVRRVRARPRRGRRVRLLLLPFVVAAAREHGHERRGDQDPTRGHHRPPFRRSLPDLASFAPAALRLRASPFSSEFSTRALAPAGVAALGNGGGAATGAAADPEPADGAIVGRGGAAGGVGAPAGLAAVGAPGVAGAGGFSAWRNVTAVNFAVRTISRLTTTGLLSARS